MAKDGDAKLGASYVKNAAFHYLGRFNSSTANLRTVLERKIWRRKKRADLPDTGLTTEERGWIEDAVTACVAYGYVDDERYARDRAQSLLIKGKPIRHIKSDLASKGIDSDMIGAALGTLKDSFRSADGENQLNADQYAAARYVRRRRFGAYRRSKKLRESGTKQTDSIFEKELASMARAGFSYEISKKTLALSLDDISALINGAELG